MVALEETESLEEHGKEDRDGRDDDRDFVAAPVRIVAALLRGTVDHRYDSKRRDGEQIQYEQVDNTAGDDYLPAVCVERNALHWRLCSLEGSHCYPLALVFFLLGFLEQCLLEPEHH